MALQRMVVEGLEFACEGSGPAVLLLHGTPGGYDAGLVAAKWLGLTEHRVYAVSRPGYLGSALLDASLDQQALRLGRALRQLVQDRVAVVAFSGGGPLALAFAERCPEQVRGLALLSAQIRRKRTWPWRVVPDAWWAAGVRASAAADVLPRQWIVRVLPEFARDMLGSTLPLRPRLEGFVFDEVEFRNLADPDTDRLTCPCLIVHGTRDPIVPHADAAWLASRVRDARMVSIAGAGHGAMFREEAKQALRGFLRGLDVA